MGGVDSRDGAAIVVVILFVCCFFTSVRTGSEVGFLGRLSDFGAEWVTWDDNLSTLFMARISGSDQNLAYLFDHTSLMSDMFPVGM